MALDFSLVNEKLLFRRSLDPDDWDEAMRDIQKDLNLVNQMWERSLTVSLIAENLEHCCQHDHAESILRRMEENNWDLIGLCSNQATGATATNYLRRQDLEGKCGALSYIQGQPIDITNLVSGDTPIAHCLDYLVKQQRLFVLDSGGVRQIVTLADLNKQPVRIMLFAAVSLLEMAMLSKIQELFQHSEWGESLPTKRVEKAKKLLAQREKKGQDITLAECLQLSDKAEILLKHPQTFYREWEFKSNTQAKKFFKKLTSLRDQLAHSQDPTGDSDWSEVGKLYSRTETLIRKMTAGSSD